MKKLILFLIRKKLGLKKHEYFQFVGQRTENVYYFDKTRIVKMEPTNDKFYIYVKGLDSRYKLSDSGVSVNWILNDECKIRKVIA